MTIEKIISSSLNKHEKWELNLRDHIEVTYGLKEFSKDYESNILFQTNDLLFEISENFFKYGNFKDDWDTSKFSMNYMGQNLLLKSLKTSHVFDWGVYQDHFYLDAYFLHSENIRYMGDDFWKTLLELDNYGQFSFVESCGLSKQYKEHFGNKKSNVFRVIRDYLLFQVETIYSTDYQRDPNLNLGSLELKWEFGTDWSVIVENSCKAFKALYQLNYQLWKVSDLKKKKQRHHPSK